MFWTKKPANNPEKQETDRDGFHPVFLELSGRAPDGGLVQRGENVAARRHQPLAHRQSVLTPDQWFVLPRNLQLNRIILRAPVPADMKNVAEPFGGDHAGTRAVIFQDGVRRDGRTVKHMVDRGRIDLIVCAEIRKTVDHADGWVRGRRQHFVGQRSIALGVRAHQVRKRAADVNANQVHRVPFPPELSQFVLEVAFVEIVYWNWQ